MAKRIKAKLHAAIIADKLNDPDLTTRELGNKYDISNATASKIVKEIPELTKVNAIANVLDTCKLIITDGLESIHKDIKEGTAKTNEKVQSVKLASDIVNLAEGKPTEHKKLDISGMSPQEMADYIRAAVS